MIKVLEKAIYVAIFIALTMAMLGATHGDNLANWGEFTKGFAQIKVTIALGYAALIAAIAATFKHAGQFAKHKKALYNMIVAFCFMIFMDILLYSWSFDENLRKGNIAIYLLGCWAFLYVTSNFFKVIREMINVEEK